MTQSEGLTNYLAHLARSLPGGVDCDYCHFVNTYVHVSLKWKDLGGDRYGFRQQVRCDKCGHNHVYEWQQKVRPDFGVTMYRTEQKEEENNA